MFKRFCRILCFKFFSLIYPRGGVLTLTDPRRDDVGRLVVCNLPMRSFGRVVRFSGHRTAEYLFAPRTVNVWNSLPEIVILADTTDTFKRRLDKFWQHQDII